MIKSLHRVSGGENRGGKSSQTDRRSAYYMRPAEDSPWPAQTKPSVSINCPRKNYIRFVILPACFSVNGHGNHGVSGYGCPSVPTNLPAYF